MYIVIICAICSNNYMYKSLILKIYSILHIIVSRAKTKYNCLYTNHILDRIKVMDSIFKWLAVIYILSNTHTQFTIIYVKSICADIRKAYYHEIYFIYFLFTTIMIERNKNSWITTMRKFSERLKLSQAQLVLLTKLFFALSPILAFNFNIIWCSPIIFLFFSFLGSLVILTVFMLDLC